MRTIFHSLLIIAITFAYVAGPYWTVEMEHSHEICENHGHLHTGDDQDHSHHPHDEEPIRSSEAPDSNEPESDSHSHTHVVSLGLDTPFTPASHNTFMANMSGAYHTAAILQLVPDGPIFELIKPPQIG